jgi:hypothetical protein
MAKEITVLDLKNKKQTLRLKEFQKATIEIDGVKFNGVVDDAFGGGSDPMEVELDPGTYLLIRLDKKTSTIAFVHPADNRS